MSSFRIAASAAVLALSAAAWSAPAAAFSAGESASASSVAASSGPMVTRGQAGAGRPGHAASSATGNPLAYDMAVSRSQQNGLESSFALSNNASAQDHGRGNASAVFAPGRLAAR